MKNKKFKVCIIGCGRMGQRYIDICNKKKVEIVFVIDKNIANLNLISKKYPNLKNKVNSKIIQKYKSVNLDCAIIATTSDQRLNIVKKIIGLKCKKILIEKPIADTLDRASKILKICKKNKIKISVNHQMKFMDVYNYPLSISKKLNDPIKSMIVQTGNFGLGMNVIHYFEAFKYVTNAKPIYVNAYLEKKLISNPRGNKFKDKAGQIRVTDKEGKRLYIEFGSDLGHNITVIYSAKNYQIIIDELSGASTLIVRKKLYFDKPTNLIALPSNKITKNLKSLDIFESTWNVLHALLNNKKNYVNAISGFENIKIAIASIISSNSDSKTIHISKIKNNSKETKWA